MLARFRRRSSGTGRPRTKDYCERSRKSEDELSLPVRWVSLRAPRRLCRTVTPGYMRGALAARARDTIARQ